MVINPYSLVEFSLPKIEDQLLASANGREEGDVLYRRSIPHGLSMRRQRLDKGQPCLSAYQLTTYYQDQGKQLTGQAGKLEGRQALVIRLGISLMLSLPLWNGSWFEQAS